MGNTVWSSHALWGPGTALKTVRSLAPTGRGKTKQCYPCPRTNLLPISPTGQGPRRGDRDSHATVTFQTRQAALPLHLRCRLGLAGPVREAPLSGARELGPGRVDAEAKSCCAPWKTLDRFLGASRKSADGVAQTARRSRDDDPGSIVTAIDRGAPADLWKSRLPRSSSGRNDDATKGSCRRTPARSRTLPMNSCSWR